MMLLRTVILAALYSGVAAQQLLTLRNLIVDRPDLNKFREALNGVGLLETVLDDNTQQFTIFAPTDEAVDANVIFSTYYNGLSTSPPKWQGNLLPAVKNHMIEGASLKRGDIFNSQTTEIQSMTDKLRVSQFLQVVGGAQIVTADIEASNGMLHVVSRVIEPAFFENTLANLELQPEFGPDHLGRVSLQTVVDFVGARSHFYTLRPEGMTQVGCRIRAFNRMGLDYLPQTINDSNDVKYGEFLNASFKNETIDNFIRYSLIPRTYYMDDIPNRYEDLIFPVNNCSHMWITKRDGRLCFNDGCVVSTPYARQFPASNG